MAGNKLMEKMGPLLNKYKYAALVLIIGIVFMIIPSQNDHTGEEITTKTVEEKIMDEAKLEQILSYIDGAGNVKVLITEKYGEETIYQINEDISVSENNSSNRTETVLLSDSDRNEIGLVRQTNPAVYQGAIILCQGADDPVVRLRIYEAVSKVTGLGADKIAVIKMKS